MVRYADGNEVKVGDAVAIDTNYRGVVVASIDTGEYSDGYSEKQWAYLGNGILINTDFGGLVHYPSAHNEKLVLLHRGDEP